MATMSKPFIQLPAVGGRQGLLDMEAVFVDSPNLHVLLRAQYVARVTREKLAVVRLMDWPTDVVHMPDALRREAIFVVEGHHMVKALGRIDDALVMVQLAGGRVDAEVAARTPEAVARAVAALETLVPRLVVGTEQRIPVTFWMLGQHGARAITRKLAVPTWAQITENYSARTQRALGPMMATFRPGAGGQLLLWMGPMGTGKTTGIRALIWEWRTWATFHYVTDPETFFGKRTDYLLEVLLHESEESVPEGSVSPENRWRVLLLEDTGELLSVDAKERVGQGLSRLLNATDGLLGQGLRVLAMLTTNEDIRKVHPAVARPGRCAFRHEFEALPAAEANVWLLAHGCQQRPLTRPVTIAELYGIAEEREPMPLSSALAWGT